MSNSTTPRVMDLSKDERDELSTLAFLCVMLLFFFLFRRRFGFCMKGRSIEGDRRKKRLNIKKEEVEKKEAIRTSFLGQSAFRKGIFRLVLSESLLLSWLSQQFITEHNFFDFIATFSILSFVLDKSIMRSFSTFFIVAVFFTAAFVASSSSSHQEDGEEPRVAMEFQSLVSVPEGWVERAQSVEEKGQKASFLIALKVRNTEELFRITLDVSSK
jgi:hypothetical protein